MFPKVTVELDRDDLYKITGALDNDFKTWQQQMRAEWKQECPDFAAEEQARRMDLIDRMYQALAEAGYLEGDGHIEGEEKETS